MGEGWILDVPEPIYVTTDAEAYDLRDLMMKKMELFPNEPIAMDTETRALKVPVRNRLDEKGQWIPDAEPAPSDPLDWMRDTVVFWSLSAQVDRELEPFMEEYLQKWHPDHPRDQYARWCINDTQLFILGPFLEHPKTILATWNGKYDAHVMWNSGVNIFLTQVWDLLVAASIYDENLQGKLSLKDRAREWCGLNNIKFQDLFGNVILEDGSRAVEYKTSLKVLPREDVVHYASYDAYMTLKVYEWLYYRMNSRGEVIEHPWSDPEIIPDAVIQEVDGAPYTLWDHFLHIEVPFTECLWRMERRGLPINVKSLDEVGPRILKEISGLEHDISKEVGCVLNTGSPKQLVQYFFGEEHVTNPKKNLESKRYTPVKMTTKGGKTPSTDEEVLEVLVVEHQDPVAKMVLRCRKLAKMYGTYINALKAMSGHHMDRRIHPSFNQHGARTGRLSTTGPNSQNFPRADGDEFGIRTMFIAAPGCRLIIGDFAQLEMRIMCHFSMDKNMLKAINDGMDLHCFTVALMNNIPYEEAYGAVEAKEIDGKRKKEGLPPLITDRQKWLLQQRQAAKAIGFGLIYGAGPPRIASQLEISEDEAADKIDAYFDAFPGVLEFINYTHKQCEKIGHVLTLVGRRRRLKDIRSKNRTLRGLAERESVNSRIQGSAADITKAAMLNVEEDPTLNKMGLWLLNQIHDEIVCEIPEKYADEALDIVKRHMEFPFNGEQALVVPTPVDIKVVDTWAEK